MLRNISSKAASISILIAFSSLAFAGTNIWTETGPNASNARVELSANPSVAFARGGDKFWKSTDGGVTWVTKRAANTDNYPFTLDPSDENILLLQGTFYEGLLKSVDGGETFASVSSMETNGIKFSPDGSAVYALTTSSPYVRRSNDKGSTWSNTSDTGLPPPPASLGPIPTPFEIAIHPSNANIVYLGYRNDNAQGVYKTVDGGMNWTAATGLLGIYVNAIAIQPDDPTHVYIATDSGLYRSLDSGTSWNKVSDTSNSGIATTAVSAIAFDPANSAIIYVGGARRGEIFRSSDGGTSWQRRDQGIVATAITSLSVFPGGSGELLAGTTHTVYRTTNSGQSWTVSANGIRASNIETVSNGSKLRVGLSDGGVYESDDGSNWTPLNNAGLRDSLPNQQFSQILEIHDVGKLFLLTNNGALARSTDGGNSWLPRPATFNPLQNGSSGGFITESGTGPVHYAATYSGVLKTTDDGDTWSVSSSGISTPFVGSLAKNKDGSVLYAGTLNGGVFKSVDHGGSWVAVNNGLTSQNNLDIRSLAYDDVNDVLVVGTNDGLFASSNGGSSYTPLTNPFPGAQASIDTILVEDFLRGAIYVGMQGRVYRSVDSGMSWTELAAGASISTFRRISKLVGDGPGVIYVGAIYTGLDVFTVSPDLQLLATAPSAGNFAIGTQIPWSVTVTNNGPFAATFSNFSWQLPANISIVNPTSTRGTCTVSASKLFTCDFGVMQPGQTATVNMTISGDSGGTVHLNASAGEAELDLAPSNNSFTDSGMRFVEQVDLKTTLQASATTVNSGGTFDYTLTVVNNGTTIATGATIQTSFDARDQYSLVQGTLSGCTGSIAGTLQCPLPALAPGASAVYRWTVTPVPGGPRSASAAAIIDTDKSNDTDLTNNLSSTSLTVMQANDLAIAFAGVATSAPQGTAFSYTLTATNYGVIDANPVAAQIVLGDNLSFVSASGAACTDNNSVVSCDLGSLASGGSKDVVITVNPESPGTTTSTASISGPNLDPNISNNSASAALQITPVTDLSVTFTTLTGSIEQGASFAYTLTATNNSLNDANTITAHVTLSSQLKFEDASGATCTAAGGVVTCDLGTITAGSSKSVTINVTGVAAGMATGSADISGTDPDPDTTNNSASASKVTVSSPPAPPASGNTGGGGGGGGGAMDYFLLVALASMLLLMRLRKFRSFTAW